MYLTEDELNALGLFISIHEEHWLVHAMSQGLTASEAMGTVKKLEDWGPDAPANSGPSMRMVGTI